MRLAGRLRAEEPEVFHLMLRNGFSNWVGLHYELLSLPAKEPGLAGTEIMALAEAYAETSSALRRALCFIASGAASLALGCGLFLWLVP
jgi:hypothetical protein